MTDPGTSLALAALSHCRQGIRAARIDAVTATAKLTGTQRIEAEVIVHHLTVALDHAERLTAAVRSEV